MRVKVLAIGVACAVALCGPASATTIGASISHFDENALTLIIGALKAEAQRTGTTIAFEDAVGDADRQIGQVQNHVDVPFELATPDNMNSSVGR